HVVVVIASSCAQRGKPHVIGDGGTLPQDVSPVVSVGPAAKHSTFVEEGDCREGRPRSARPRPRVKASSLTAPRRCRPSARAIAGAVTVLVSRPLTRSASSIDARERMHIPRFDRVGGIPTCVRFSSRSLFRGGAAHRFGPISAVIEIGPNRSCRPHEALRGLATPLARIVEETMFRCPRLTCAVTLIVMATAVTSTSAQPAVTDWPMYQFDLKHTGKSTAAGPGAGTQGVQVKWTYRSVSWVKNQIAIGPTVPPPNAGIPGQAVFFGDAKFPLCMVDPNRADADPATWCTDIGGFVNTSSPAIGNPVGGVQTIYMGDRNNVFWAIDSKTHQPLWHWKIPLDGDVRASPIINPVNGTVYGSCGCTTTGV